MKVGEILRDKQAEIYKELNSEATGNRKKGRGIKGNKEALSFSDIENMMKHDSHTRGRGGAIKQKMWGI